MASLLGCKVVVLPMSMMVLQENLPFALFDSVIMKIVKQENLTHGKGKVHLWLILVPKQLKVYTLLFDGNVKRSCMKRDAGNLHRTKHVFKKKCAFLFEKMKC
eukprot:TRINITY_DN8773_c0_g1_i1.p1 TRINITY_DN8773_c0_g1~~TRINITY_DN8773_c0_g1_i1.p1  ORF type:complete len:103 (-),score=6.71 TRINITY_DN8773_c0_g1_i1:130-438(-)